MKILYLDCGMGAAGDMLSAALFELLPDKEVFLKKLNHLQIPGVCFEALTEVKAGITGTRMKVTIHGVEEGKTHHHDHDPEQLTEYIHSHGHEQPIPHVHSHSHDYGHYHHHYGLHDIGHIVLHMEIPDAVKENILGVYRLIADAESRVHGEPVDQIHFHEVGSLDAVADVAAVCLLLAELAPDRVIVSPVCTGSGTVKCAHGILPVPAPATALLLEGVPVFSGPIKSELCTPTGAALLKYFADDFAGMPMLTIERIGYGMGTKDFGHANFVRAILGTADKDNPALPLFSGMKKTSASITKLCSQGTAEEEDRWSGNEDEVIELACNLDDMTAEEIAFAAEKLLEGGAKDVWTTPIGMKKSRPGTMLTVLCDASKKAHMLQLLFTHTTTIGVRETLHQRYILNRTEETVDTVFGPVRKKVSEGFGMKKEKWEYDDLAQIAAREGSCLAEVKTRLLKNKDARK